MVARYDGPSLPPYASQQTQPPRPPRVEDCYSYRQPAAFDVDWASFYRNALGWRDELRQWAPHELNVRYGQHPFQIMNIYLPQRISRPAAVLMFLHGGAFREGHPAFYDFLAENWIRRDVVFVSVGYRLAPECPYPDNVPDLQHAVRWVYANIDRYGGDPTRIVVSGHSAGAVLAAAVGFRDDWQRGLGLPQDVVRGAVLVSGLYDFRQESFGLVPDPNKRVSASPICHIQRTPLSTVVAFGSDEANRTGGDLRMFTRSALPFVDAVRAANGAARAFVLPFHDHIATSYAISEPEHVLHEATARLIDEIDTC